MKKFSNKINQYGLLSDKDCNPFEIVSYEDEEIEEETENTIGGMQI